MKIGGFIIIVVILGGIVSALIYLSQMSSGYSFADYPGAVEISKVAVPGDCVSKELATKDPPEAVRSYYRQKLLVDGWSLRYELHYNSEGSYELLFDKGSQNKTPEYRANIYLKTMTDGMTHIAVSAQTTRVGDSCRRSQPLPLYSPTAAP